AFLTFLPVLGLLTVSCQDAVVRGDLDVLELDAWELDREGQRHVGLADVHCGRPLTLRKLATCDVVIEQSVDLRVRAEERGGRDACVPHTCLCLTRGPNCISTG